MAIVTETITFDLPNVHNDLPNVYILSLNNLMLN